MKKNNSINNLLAIIAFCYSFSAPSQLHFRYDTAERYEGTRRIVHTSYQGNQEEKWKIDLNNKGEIQKAMGYDRNDPKSPNFLLKEHLIFNSNWKSDFKYDSVGRVIKQTLLVDNKEVNGYKFQFQNNNKRPSIIKQLSFELDSSMSYTNTVFLSYAKNKITQKHPYKQGFVTSHHLYNKKGNLIKFYIEGHQKDSVWCFEEIDYCYDSTPLEYRYEYDDRGRMTKMFETTNGANELLFTRRYFTK